MITKPFSTLEPRSIDWLTKITPDSVFIPEELSDELSKIQDEVWKFYEAEIVPFIPQLEKTDPVLLKKLLRKMGAEGLLNPGIPKQYGGKGYGLLASALVNFSGGVYTSFGVAMAAHSGIGTIPILYFGNKDQKNRYLPKLATGEFIAAYGLTEPNSGSDALSIRTTAVMSDDGKHYILNGQKCWITNGGIGDVFTIFAKVDGEHFTAFIVDGETEGFSKGSEENKMGLNGSSTVQLYMQDCKVPVENVLGEVGKGHIIALNTLNNGRFKLGFMALGICHLILNDVRGFLRANVSDSLKMKLQVVKSKVARMEIKYWALQTALFRTAKMLEEKTLAYANAGDDDNTAYLKAAAEFVIEAAIMKIYSTEILDLFGDEYIQILEFNGYSEAFAAARIYRDSRVTRIFEGTNEINRLLITEMLFKKISKDSILSERINILVNENEPKQLSSEESSKESTILKDMKLALLMTASAVSKRYQHKLREEQEIALHFADLLIYTYIIDSAISRVLKADKIFPKIQLMATEKMKWTLSYYLDFFLVKCANSVESFSSFNHHQQIFDLLEKIRSDYLINRLKIEQSMIF